VDFLAGFAFGLALAVFLAADFLVEVLEGICCLATLEREM